MTKTEICSIRLDRRQAWAWERLGLDAIRRLIAPGGICVQCGGRPAIAGTRNSWFCYPCQDNLDQLSLLPTAHSEHLKKQNQDLLAQLKDLHSQVKLLQTKSPQVPQQLSLFDDP